MNNNRCVCCGEIIPEGWQVCPACKMKAEKKPKPVKYRFDAMALVVVLCGIVGIVVVCAILIFAVEFMAGFVGAK